MSVINNFLAWEIVIVAHRGLRIERGDLVPWQIMLISTIIIFSFMLLSAKAHNTKSMALMAVNEFVFFG